MYTVKYSGKDTHFKLSKYKIFLKPLYLAPPSLYSCHSRGNILQKHVTLKYCRYGLKCFSNAALKTLNISF